jgi:hypothetical protein
LPDEPRTFIGTIRCVLEAQDELEARLEMNEIVEAGAELLDDQETIDITQIVPAELQGVIEPAEMVEQLRRSRDMLIKTRIVQCFELARELDKTAWILEHRAEESFDLSGYDWGAFMDLTDKLLGRRERE